MNDGDKSKEQLIMELTEMRRRVVSLEALQAERDAVEKELRKSEASLAEAQRIAHLGNWDWDIKNNTVRWSDEMYRVFGLKPQGFGATYEAVLNLVHPDDRKFVRKAVDEAVDGKGPYNGEHRVIWTDGSVRVIRAQGEAVFDKSGQATCMTGTTLDITERKQAEKRLRDSEEKLHLIFESVHEGITVTDLKANIQELNQATVRLHGYENKKELIGRSALELISERDHTRAMANLKRTLSEGFIEDVEYSFLKSDGTEFDAELSAAVIRNSTSDPIGFVAITKDVSDDKRIRDSLMRSETRYRSLVETAGAGIGTIDSHGIFTYCNKRLSEMIGYAEEGIVGKPFTDFLHPDDRERIALQFRQGLTQPKGRSDLEFRVIHKKGNTVYMYSSPTVLRYGSETVGFSAIVTDITDRRRTEMELQESQQQLRRLSSHLQSVREEERKRMALELHDELGQTLTALNVDLSCLSGRLPKDDISLLDEVRRMLGLIDMSIRTIQRICSQLRPAILDDLGLGATIEWQAREFQNRTGIKCEVCLNIEDTVVGQEHSIAIFRIFQETLTNVVRHAAATRAQVSLERRDGKLRLKVMDNGKGITKAQLYSPESFGLIGMRERAHALGGDVKINGIPGRGTTITVGIPLDTERLDDRNTSR